MWTDEKRIERSEKPALARFISLFPGKRKTAAEEFARLSVESVIDAAMKLLGS